MQMTKSYRDLRTWRLDVVLDWATPIPWEKVAQARLDLGPAGGQSATPEGRPLINLYANAADKREGEQALQRQLEIVLRRLNRYGARVLRSAEVADAGRAFPPDEDE